MGRIASNITLHEVDKLLQVSNSDFGSAVGEALDSLDTVCNCIRHLVSMGDIVVPKLNRVREALTSC